MFGDTMGWSLIGEKNKLKKKINIISTNKKLDLLVYNLNPYF